MSEKSFPMVIKRSHNPQNGHISADNGQNTHQNNHNPTTKNVDGHNNHILPAQATENTHTSPEDINQFQEFSNIRDYLMQHAQTLAKDLLDHDEDVNLRTLALARIIDRIVQLDKLIPSKNPEKVVRFEFLYDGVTHNTPPWHNTPDEDK